MPYNDNFWHKDAHVNISSPACLIFFVKIENREPEFLLLLKRNYLNACVKAKGKHFEHTL